MNVNFSLGKVTKVKSLVIGSKQNLRKTVRAARDLNPEVIPPNLTQGGTPVEPPDLANAFAKNLSDKIKLNVSKAIFDF